MSGRCWLRRLNGFEVAPSVVLVLPLRDGWRCCNVGLSGLRSVTCRLEDLNARRQRFIAKLKLRLRLRRSLGRCFVETEKIDQSRFVVPLWRLSRNMLRLMNWPRTVYRTFGVGRRSCGFVNCLKVSKVIVDSFKLR